MALRRPGGLDDGGGLLPHHLGRREHQRRVEVALHGLARPDPADRLVERHPPVDPDDVGPGLPHVVQQLPRPDAEVDARHVRDGGQDPGAVRLHVAAVVGGGQGADPGVEQLHGAGPGVDLHPQEGLGDDGQPLHQPGPQLRVAVHEGLGAALVLARPALDQVAGQGEGGAGEADERRRAELGDQAAHALGDVGDVLGRERGQPVEVGRGADRLGDDRPDAGDDVEVDADGLERHDDVGEEDRRVDAEAADRLQGDLDDHLRPGARLEHRGALAVAAVLRQGPAGLAHEPHGGVRHALAPAGPQEGAVVRGTGGPAGTGGRAGDPVRSAGRGQAGAGQVGGRGRARGHRTSLPEHGAAAPPAARRRPSSPTRHRRHTPLRRACPFLSDPGGPLLS